MIIEREKICELRDRGAIFYVSHSGGKDSQAMFITISNFVPANQIVVVKADLGHVEQRQQCCRIL